MTQADRTQADRRIEPPHMPARAMRVFGLPRSGNHGVIKWLLRNAPCGQTLFLNNCTPFADPLASYAEAEVNGTRWKHLIRQAGSAAEASAAITAPPFLLASYERWVPGMVRRGDVSGPAEGLFEREVLIHRGFLNWLASLVALGRRRQADGAPGWADLPAALDARVANYARMLDAATAPEAPLQISYDRWFAAPDYRAQVLAELGLPCRDNGLGRVSNYGGGSSFEAGVRDAAELNANDRRTQMRDDPLYAATVARMRADAGFMARLAALYPQDTDAMTAQAA
jgi:hypothetical protein